MELVFNGKELQYQKELMIKPNRPLVLILGGAKISTKIEILEKYIDKADQYHYWRRDGVYIFQSYGI